MIDYVNTALAIILGGTILAVAISVTFGIDRVLNAILALPFFWNCGRFINGSNHIFIYDV